MESFDQSGTLMGLGRKLMAGKPIFDEADQLVRIVEQDKSVYTIPYAALTASDWGYIYERHVGLWFESLGYSVSYRGLQLGFMDGGVDLVLTRDDETIYVQCKYAAGKPITVNKLKWVFSKADTYLSKNYQGRPLHFHLIVPDRSQCFGTVKLKLNGKVDRFPVWRYVEELNRFQARLELKVVEVPMLHNAKRLRVTDDTGGHRPA